jgi:OPA family sugar phosphate sensor protein UhpC-like MFS transporter
MRTRAIALSWLAYATYYLGRKGFSVVKSSLARDFGLDTSVLALVDTGYLVAYACGQLPSGLAADRWGARRLLALGMLVSAAACAAFGASATARAFVLCFALNGLAQSTGWPGSTRIMADWTSASDRGRIMGLWSTCYQAGGIAATALATWLLQHFGWRSAFWLPASILVIVALLVWAFAPDARAASERSVARATLLRTPALYSYGACYFCIKLIRYSLLFWLPFFLHKAAGFDEITSGYLSTAFEVGGLFGSMGIGYLSDRSARSRAFVAALSLVGLAAAMWGYANISSSSIALHVGGLALVGALLFGPDALVSGAAAQDAGGAAAAGAAVGLVNGIGSAGALLQSALTVGVERAYGWHGLLHVFVGLSILASACLVPALRAPRP